MKTCLFLNFPDHKRIYSWTDRTDRPPLHTFLVFPTHHSEVKGFLSAFVTETTEYVGKFPTDDYWVIDLTPYFRIDMDTFMLDQAIVGRFEWHRDDEEPFSRM